MSATTQEVGHIDADSLYTLSDIKRRLGLGVHAMRQARRNGLAVRYIGRRGYVLGKDILAYVETAARSSGDH